MKHILACIDNSQGAAGVCDAAAWVSQQVKRPLLLLHVLDQLSYPAQTDLSEQLSLDSRTQLMEQLADLDAQRSRLALEQGQLQLDAAKQRVTDRGVEQVETLQRHGHFLQTLIDLQADTRILVMGRQGEAHQEAFKGIGSHLESVIRALSCRILVTPLHFQPPRQVLLAWDASPTANKVLDIIARSPLCKGLPIHLLMVGENSLNNRQAMLDTANQLEREGHLPVTTHIQGGEVEATLLRYQQQHQLDMIIMGAYGHTRIRQFLVGSTTTNLLHKARVPLLLMRQ